MAAVKAIHRDTAVSLWISLLELPNQPWKGDTVSLDAALASVGMFLLEDEPGDIEEVGFLGCRCLCMRTLGSN